MIFILASIFCKCVLLSDLYLLNRTTEFLMRHLAKVAAFGKETGMHSKNLAIVWAPNLLRYKWLQFSLMLAHIYSLNMSYGQ